MKKWLLGILAALTIGSLAGVAGCNLTNEQVQVIAQNAGLGAAVTWIAYDNPDTNAIALVNGVIDVIYEKAGNVQTGTTYTATIYKDIEAFVDSGVVEQKYKPITLAGSLAMLNGIDMLFALNPEWKLQEGLALQVVKSFSLGAKQGLALSERDPAIIQARAFATQRKAVRREYYKKMMEKRAKRVKRGNTKGNSRHGHRNHSRTNVVKNVEK